MAKPSQKKEKLAVIGDPVAHSLSPEMHNAALKALGLSYSYGKIHVTPKKLASFMRGEGRRLAGFNSTLPHKENLLKLVDWVAPKAKLIGAVNTVVRRDGRLLGFNTDGDGYLESLLVQRQFSCQQKNIVLLGAGGAARSLAVAMALAGARRIIIANRTPEKSKKLCKKLKGHFKRVHFSHTSLDGTPLRKALRVSDLLVNTTSVGLNNTKFENFSWQHVPSTTLVSDIVYAPLKTPFLKEAKKRGHPIHTGEGMLVYQGALSFLLWTGHQPDTELMHKVVLKKLKG